VFALKVNYAAPAGDLLVAEAAPIELVVVRDFDGQIKEQVLASVTRFLRSVSSPAA
jgi:hypothetical protein